MKIIHLDSGREMRGGQWQVLQLIEALAVAGHEQVLLARAEAPLARQVKIPVRSFTSAWKERGTCFMPMTRGAIRWQR